VVAAFKDVIELLISKQGGDTGPPELILPTEDESSHQM